MTQNELNRAVSRATGETVAEIVHRGLQPLELEPSDPARQTAASAAWSPAACNTSSRSASSARPIRAADAVPSACVPCISPPFSNSLARRNR